MVAAWDIKPGATIRRSELHDALGGGRRGGIEPSRKSPNVFLFTSDAGAEFGYEFDGWHPDGTFHYTGEGTVGDQRMREGNKATRDHLASGRALRLFEKLGRQVTYIGEFSVPDESHILIDEAPDRNGDKRSVFVFRLKPVGPSWIDTDLSAPAATLFTSMPLEAMNVEEYIARRRSSEPVTLLRREASLVGRYVEWLNRKAPVTVERHSIPTPAGHLMYTDIFVPQTRELIEAKSSSSREHIRSALGQILDYSRYVDHSSLAVLTPSEPANELTSLLLGNGVGAIWESGLRDFSRVDPPDAWRSPAPQNRQ